MDEPLDHELVYHNLKWTWSWRGLEAIHFVMASAPAVVYLVATCWVESWPKMLCLPIALSSGVAMGVLQYRQDGRWLQRKLANLGVPRHLSHRRLAAQPPFPVSREVLLCQNQ